MTITADDIRAKLAEAKRLADEALAMYYELPEGVLDQDEDSSLIYDLASYEYIYNVDLLRYYDFEDTYDRFATARAINQNV